MSHQHDPLPIQPLRLRLGFGMNVRHAYETNSETSLCSMAVPRLQKGHCFQEGEGPFCSPCLRMLSDTVPVPRFTPKEALFFLTLGATALLTSGVLLGVVLRA